MSRALASPIWSVSISAVFLCASALNVHAQQVQTVTPARAKPLTGGVGNAQYRRESMVPPPATRSSDSTKMAVSTTPSYTVTGDWTDTYDYQWMVSEADSGSITGLVDVNCGADPWVITGSGSGSSFTLLATNPDLGSIYPLGDCSAWFQYTMTFTSSTTASGSWINSVGFSGSVDMTLTETCATVINNSLSGPTLGGGNLLSGPTTISATFTPTLNGTPYGLSNAATLCGVTAFDWVQTITSVPDPYPFCENNTTLSNPQPFCGQTTSSTAPFPLHLTSASAPFNDPPPSGYPYINQRGFDTGPDSYPFYYDTQTSGYPLSLDYYLNTPSANTLNFFDSPRDSCISGPLGVPSYAYLFGSPGPPAVPASVYQAACGNSNPSSLPPYSVTPAGSASYFTTHLAGVKTDNTPLDFGIGFDWTSNYNGTFGGINTTVAIPGQPEDPNGVGGITVTNVNKTTTYEHLGTPIGSTLLTGSQVSATASGLAYSRVSQTFNGTVTITNVSSRTIAGPFQIVLNSLTSGVTVGNATSTFGGWSYVTVPTVISLAPGQSATTPVQFKNPSNATIRFIPLTYVGSFMD